MDPLRGVGHLGRGLRAVRDQRQPRLCRWPAPYRAVGGCRDRERHARVEIVVDDLILLDRRSGAAPQENEAEPARMPIAQRPIRRHPNRSNALVRWLRELDVCFVQLGLQVKADVVAAPIRRLEAHSDPLPIPLVVQ